MEWPNRLRRRLMLSHALISRHEFDVKLTHLQMTSLEVYLNSKYTGYCMIGKGKNLK